MAKKNRGYMARLNSAKKFYFSAPFRPGDIKEPASRPGPATFSVGEVENPDADMPNARLAFVHAINDFAPEVMTDLLKDVWPLYRGYRDRTIEASEARVALWAWLDRFYLGASAFPDHFMFKVALDFLDLKHRTESYGHAIRDEFVLSLPVSPLDVQQSLDAPTARKNRYAHFKWLVYYQVKGWSLGTMIQSTEIVDYDGDTREVTIFEAVASTAQLLGLTLRENPRVVIEGNKRGRKKKN